MNTPRPDITEVLEREKEHYAEQIRRINVALAALKGELVTIGTTPETTSQPLKPRTIQWAEECRKIFNTGIELSTEQLRNKFAENGIVEALEAGGKSNLYATVSRLLKGGYLEKTEKGTYLKKQYGTERPLRKLDLWQGNKNNEGSEP